MTHEQRFNAGVHAAVSELDRQANAVFVGAPYVQPARPPEDIIIHGAVDLTAVCLAFWKGYHT